jgi:hypothetical protein
MNLRALHRNNAIIALLAATLGIAACGQAPDEAFADDDASTEGEWIDETSDALTTTTNVALHRPVSVIGQAAGTPSKVTDGQFAPEHTPWDTAHYAVIVGSTNPPSALVVNLAENYPISSIKLQADCNDGYLVEGSSDGSTWSFLHDFGMGECHGLVTRPTHTFANRPWVRYIKITPHRIADYLYSISEIQVFWETSTDSCCSDNDPVGDCPHVVCPD